MQSVSWSCTALSWRVFASFLLFSMWIRTGVVHHGGLTNGRIFSILVPVYSGKPRAIYSRFEIALSLLDLIARSTQKDTGFSSGRVCILVKDLRILLWSLILAGGRAVSISKAGVDVVLKHPMIAFIAIRCADVSLLSCGGACFPPYFRGRCQIDAA